MKIRRLRDKIATEINKSEILTTLHGFLEKMRCIWSDRSGTGEPEAAGDVLCGSLAMQNIVIGGVIYLVRSYFREDTTTTRKGRRKFTVKCLDAEIDSE